MWEDLGQGFLKEIINLNKESSPRAHPKGNLLCGELRGKDSLGKSYILIGIISLNLLKRFRGAPIAKCYILVE